MRAAEITDVTLLQLDEYKCVQQPFCLSLPLLLVPTISCTCCYDEIKGIQDLKISFHADSLILTLTSASLSTVVA